jgi:hypothetical protein
MDMTKMVNMNAMMFGRTKMKKLFASVPMKGRTDEEISESIMKMLRIAEAYEGEKLELINSWVDEDPPADCNRSVWYLGKSIEKLAEADIFIGIEDSIHYPGCVIEKQIAANYGIKSYIIPQNVILLRRK